MEKVIKNITAERIVVGILLNQPEWLIEMNGLVTTEQLYQTGHKLIFHIVKTLLSEGMDNIDSMAVLARAEKIARATQVLEQNGGIEYLEEIRMLSEDYTLEDLKEYAGEVRLCSYKRDQLKILQNEIDYISVEDATMDEIETKIQQDQQELSNRYSASQKVGFIDDVFDMVWDEIEANRQGDGIVGLPSKIKMVNDYFTYQNGELVVIGARAKFGKSNYAINEVHNLSVNHGVPVAYFDTEMKTRTFLLRVLALDSGIPTRDIASGDYLNDPIKVKKIEASKKRIRKAPILHMYDAHWTKESIAHMSKLLKLRHNIGLLVYDYIKVKEVGKGVKEHNELGNMTIFLKDLAGDLDIPILTFAQLSPYERRVADSDKINRYASVIAYLLPKTKEQIQNDLGQDGGRDYMYVDYNRIGADMSEHQDKGINLLYDRNISKFEQAPYQSLVDDYV